MSRILNRIRLLPIVVLIGFVLLGVKGFGILHEAQAESAGDAAPAMQAEAIPSSDPDPAADDSELASASEVDVLTSLARRRIELDAREQKIAMRENVIAAAERRVDTRISELQTLEAEIRRLLGQRDTEEQKQIASLVKTYAAMKPRDAARIFAALDEDVLLAVTHQMKPDGLAPVLAAMPADAAQKLTLRLAERLKVKIPPPAPPPAPAAPAPDSTAQTAPQTSPAPPASEAPAQTAAAAPTATATEPKTASPPQTAKPGG